MKKFFKTLVERYWVIAQDLKCLFGHHMWSGYQDELGTNKHRHCAWCFLKQQPHVKWR